MIRFPAIPEKDLTDAQSKVIAEIASGPRGCTVRGPAGSWGADEAWEATHRA